MIGARLISAAGYRRLKAATAAAIAATPEGSAAAFAPRTRVSERTLRLYADHSSELFAPLDVVADIEAATAEPIIARVLADLSGCVLAPKRADPTSAAIGAIRATSNATAHIAAMVEDAHELNALGGWGREAAKEVLRDVRDALASLAGLELELKRRLEGKE